MAGTVTERSPLLQSADDSYESERIYICKVCSKRGTIPSNFNGRVVKCNNCNEGTPISLPPPGKNQRVVEVSPPDAVQLLPRQPPRQREERRRRRDQCLCPHCKHVFDWPAGKQSTDCGFCQKQCVLDPRWSRSQAQKWLVVGVILTLAVVGLVVGTFKVEKHYKYIVAGWAVGGVIALLCVIRGLIYWRLSRFVAKPLSS